MSRLSRTTIHYELTPSDTLEAEIRKRYKGLTTEKLKDSWKARVRFLQRGKRVEIYEKANDPREAIKKLHQRLTNEGVL